MENYHGYMEVFKNRSGQIIGVLELPEKDGKRRKYTCYGDSSKSEFDQWREIVNKLSNFERKE